MLHAAAVTVALTGLPCREALAVIEVSSSVLKEQIFQAL